MASIAYLFHVGQSYYITHSFNDDLCDLSFHACEVDELIAEPLMMLCNKGYITNFSCSGHPFGDCSYKLVEDESVQEEEVPTDYIMRTPFLDTGAVALCTIKPCSNIEMYISFESDHRFSSLPKDWLYEYCSLRKKIRAKNAIDFYKQAISALESLEEWIQKLPTIHLTSSKKE